MQFKHQQGLFKPVSTEAIEFTHSLKHDEIVYFEEKKDRDLRFHRAYFALLNYIYSWMPEKFKMQIPEKHFYNWLKILLNDYEVIFTFKNGEKLIESKSIAFGKMSQKTFENYVREQLPKIYDNVIYTLFSVDKAAAIIENIEVEFEKYLNNL
jgi:hypothetical protein